MVSSPFLVTICVLGATLFHGMVSVRPETKKGDDIDDGVVKSEEGPLEAKDVDEEAPLKDVEAENEQEFALALDELFAEGWELRAQDAPRFNRSRGANVDGTDEDVHYTLTEGSQIKDGDLKVTIDPLDVENGTNMITYGATTQINLQFTLTTTVSDGATAQAWFSELSMPLKLARFAIDGAIPYVDICGEMGKHGASCPINSGQNFAVSREIGPDIWAKAEKYVSKSKVQGVKGVIELRVWASKPSMLGSKPPLLAGISLPIQIK